MTNVAWRACGVCTAGLLLASAVSCRKQDPTGDVTPGPSHNVTTFLADANVQLLRLGLEASQAGWVQETYITPDTEAMSARANEAYTKAATEYAKQAAKFALTDGTDAERRQITVLKNTITVAAPADDKEASELAQILSSLNTAYGSGKYCETPDKCLDVEAVTKILAENRDPMRLRKVWEGWHQVGAPMRKPYARFVELSNKGAKEIGFADTGDMWRSRYDIPAEDFAKELDRLWEQLRPLYLSLHTYVRTRLHRKYGDAVPAEGPIPAHLLGNIWAQSWTNLYDLAAPSGNGQPVPLDRILSETKLAGAAIAKYGEGFFTSLGFEPLPKTFWERSLFVKPADREVVCHPSAWNIDSDLDVRIKMCIDPTAEDFAVIHHELGHNFYQRAYRTLPPILRDGANDGFHEAIGDTIALSITPEYLVKIKLLDKAPDISGDISLLLTRALDKVPFLAFGRVVDEWRWRIFKGDVSPERYNQVWWELRERYQGVRAPSPRGEEFFDAGAKYHVPGNTPYARYFLSLVLQFQFHRALARAAGCTAPLHRCSIYQSPAAGERLKSALALGASKPWPDALEALTGQHQMDASAMADYFAPLKTWLDEQNKGAKIGW